MELDEIKNQIKNNLLIINDNIERCVIKVDNEDLKKVDCLLGTDNINELIQCNNEMDDIINGIIINIDNELKELLNKSMLSSDYNFRKEILDKIISISDSIKYEEDNKKYFMSIIKKIYNNIDGDNM